MLTKICDRVIEYSFYLLLFSVPLILTPLNYELFEYNKMMATYILTVVIIGTWLIRMVVVKEFRVQRTPLDIPILLFLISQFLSFVFSIDRHVSLWGYYSRSHGGLFSTISYFLLFYAAVSNLDKEKVLRSLKITLLSGTFVAAYGVAEHFGIDAKFWVQDVRNRVFSTLGQPNWLAAYLSILIPIAMAFGLQKLSPFKIGHEKNHELGIKNHGNGSRKFYFPLFIILASLFYLALLYTKSRSGFLGFWVGNLIFWGIFVLKFKKEILKWLIILNSIFLILNFVVGSPFEQINKYFSFTAIESRLTHKTPPPPLPPQAGGTESGEIRKIVWKGAVDVWRHYPIFGSGVETFAFSYYQYRPVEHNMVSEWDFLYNKAHNEYLNILATTGAFGLGSYLLVIGGFLWWNIKQFKIQNSKFPTSLRLRGASKIQNSKVSDYTLYPTPYTLTIALLAGYASILVSNFFGFSVVIVALFFFLIPAFSFILGDTTHHQKTWTLNFSKDSFFQKQFNSVITHLHSFGNARGFGGQVQQLSTSQWIIIASILLFTVYCLLFLSRLWWADTHFARGYNLNQLEHYSEAYTSLKQAVSENPGEPLYRDELSSAAANLALESLRQRDATQAASLAHEAINENQKALEISPRNVNFWKTRTRVLYTLAAFNEEYNQEALEAIKVAQTLAPTDAKVSYNVAILYGRIGQAEEAVKTLEETIKLKPDYRDARYALALYLKAEGKNEEAVRELKYILEKISSEDEQVKETLKSWETTP